jgi:hypothetical protein
VAVAQEALGRITGTVLDPAGAIVPGAQITARHSASGVTTSTLSTATGDYMFPALPFGDYILRVTAPGFKTLEQGNVKIVAGVTVTVDLHLQVGATTQTVSVSAAPARVDTVSNVVGLTMEGSQITTLPLQFAGGVSSSGFRSAFSFGNTQSTIDRSYSIAGSEQNMNQQLTDGVPASSAANTPSGGQFPDSPEMVEEVRLAPADFTAEYGTTYGVTMTIVTKSGTNSFHGAAFDYFRNKALDARNFFSPTKTLNNNNEWGAVVGGPIKKNKAFFMVDYGGAHVTSVPTGQIATVPTAKMRNGDFSELLGAQAGVDGLGRPVYSGEIFDPATTRELPSGAFVRDPFMYNGQLNVMDPARFSSISTSFQNHYPLPTTTGVVNNWLGNGYPDTEKYSKISAKVDYQISNTQSLSVQFNARPSSYIAPAWGGGVRLFDPDLAGIPKGISNIYRPSFNYFWSIHPNLLLNVRGGFNRNSQNLGKLPDGGLGAQAGITGVLVPDTPVVSVQNMTGFGFGFTVHPGIILGQQNIPLNLDLTWTKGGHTLKFGASYYAGAMNGVEGFVQPPAGSFNFTALETGMPGFSQTGAGYASYLLGVVHNSALSTIPSFRFRTNTFGFYAQDAWRVTPNLTLNYGLRWNLFLPMVEAHDRISAFDPSAPNAGAGGMPGALTFWGKGAGQNGRHGLWNTDFGVLCPNFGLAYAIRPKTVIKAAAGIDTTGLYGALTMGLSVPQYGYSATLTPATLNNGVTPAFNWNGGFPIPIPSLPDLDPTLENGFSPNYVAPSDIRPGRVVMTNLGIETEVKGGVVLRANYIGRFSHGLADSNLVQLNQLNPTHLGLGDTLLADINSPQAIAAGISAPYPGFSGSVAQALRPYPAYQGVNEVIAPAGFSTYNGLELTAQRRLSRNLLFLVSYTASKHLTNTYGVVPQYTGLRSQNKALYYADEPQNLVITYAYSLPFGPGQRFANTTNPVLKQLVSGWQITGIHQYESGVPISISTIGSVPGGYGSIWANLNPGVPIGTGISCGNLDPGNPSRNRFLNINAFSTPAPFTFGNTAVLPSTRSCGTLNEDLAALKQFAIHESVRFELGMEVFNLFNRHQWTGLSTNIGNPGAFGQYTGASDQRIMQAHLKVLF